MNEIKYIHNRGKLTEYCNDEIDNVIMCQICFEMKEYLYENFFIESDCTFDDVDWNQVDKKSLYLYLFGWLKNNNWWCGLNQRDLKEIIDGIIENGGTLVF